MIGAIVWASHFYDGYHVLDWVTLISEVLGIFLAVGAVVVWARKPLTRLKERDEEITKTLASIQSQFSKNGGSSLRDSNDRVERKLDSLTERFDEHMHDHATSRLEG